MVVTANQARPFRFLSIYFYFSLLPFRFHSLTSSPIFSAGNNHSTTLPIPFNYWVSAINAPIVYLFIVLVDSAPLLGSMPKTRICFACAILRVLLPLLANIANGDIHYRAAFTRNFASLTHPIGAINKRRHHVTCVLRVSVAVRSSLCLRLTPFITYLNQYQLTPYADHSRVMLPHHLCSYLHRLACAIATPHYQRSRRHNVTPLAPTRRFGSVPFSSPNMRTRVMARPRADFPLQLGSVYYFYCRSTRRSSIYSPSGPRSVLLSGLYRLVSFIATRAYASAVGADATITPSRTVLDIVPCSCPFRCFLCNFLRLIFYSFSSPPRWCGLDRLMHHHLFSQ